MKRTSERMLCFVACIAALGVGPCAVLQSVATSQRDKAVAEFRQRAKGVLDKYTTAQPREAGADNSRRPQGESASDAARHAETVAAYDALAKETEALLAERWSKTLEEILRKDRAKWSEEERELMRQLLLGLQDLLRKVRELAERGGPVHVLDFSEGLAMPLPHLDRIRQWARLLTADAVFKVENGNHEEAVADILAAMKLGDALAKEPLLICQFTRMAIHVIADRGLQQAFGPRELPPDLARQIVAHAGQADHRQGFADMFAGEGLCGVHAFAELNDVGWRARLGQWDMHSQTYPPLGDQPPATLTTVASFLLYASPLGGSMRATDEQLYTELMERLEQVAGLPFYEAYPIVQSIEQRVRTLSVNRQGTMILGGEMCRAYRAQARHEARLDVLQMGLLLEVSHMERGYYPEDLDAIVSDLGGSVPVDPFTGGPYHYTPRGDTFLLYSIGENLRDDGGVHNYREGDIVWRGQETP